MPSNADRYTLSINDMLEHGDALSRLQWMSEHREKCYSLIWCFNLHIFYFHFKCLDLTS